MSNFRVFKGTWPEGEGNRVVVYGERKLNFKTVSGLDFLSDEERKFFLLHYRLGRAKGEISRSHNISKWRLNRLLSDAEVKVRNNFPHLI